MSDHQPEPSKIEALPCVISRGAGKRAVVFLHGVGLSASTFAPLVEAVGETRRAVAVPLPGYDGAPMIEPYTMLSLSLRLGHVLDGLGVETIDFVGHSLGGMLALEFFARQPQRVASFAFVATTPVFGSKDGRFEEAFLADRLGALDAGKSMQDIAAQLMKGALGDSPDPAGVEAAIASQAAVPEAAYRASVKSLIGFDRREELTHIGVPAICIAGETDKLAPPRSMERMAQAIPGGEFAVIAGAGHLVYLERPSEFRAVLTRFLDEKAPIARAG